MADELIDIWDEHAQPTGVTMMKSEAHKKGLWHPTSHVWIFTKSGDVLLQKRAATKDLYPDLYSVSSAGHLGAGETPIAGALRELNEELGILIPASDLVFADRFSLSSSVPHWLLPHKEYVHVFFYVAESKDMRVIVQEDEISRVDWFDVASIRSNISNGNKIFIDDNGYFAYAMNLIEKYIRGLH